MIDICQHYSEGRCVKSVVIEIGSLSGVVPEAVEFCFAACARETEVEGARLEIRRLAAQGKCLECNTMQQIEQMYDPCSNCGSFMIEVSSGKEMRVLEIEVDDG
jgi:hydrogenase nickel incorporation protein HypA/HybF